MNKKNFLFSLLILSSSYCFGVTTTTWTPTQSPYAWGAAPNWLPQQIPQTTDFIAVINGGLTNYPIVDNDYTIRQFQLLNTTATAIHLSTLGTTTIGFGVDSTINQIEFKGQTTSEASFLTTGNSVKLKDLTEKWLTGTSSIVFSRDGTEIDLLEGTGIVDVQSYTVLNQNPTSTNTGFTNNYQFSGTINLDNDYATWLITTASGPYVGYVTGSNANALVRVGDNLTLYNSHTYSGTTELYGKTLTLGTSSGSLPSSPILFSGSSPKLLLSGDASIGGLLENTTPPTTPTVALGANTLTINQGVTSVDLQNYIVGDNNFSGVISGSGGIVKAGSETLQLSGQNLYTGATAANAGTLNVNGTIATSSLLTVGTSGTVTGTGTLPATTNNGIVSPGNSVGTQTISGNYIQSSTGNLVIEVSSDPDASMLDISGTATLDGTLTLELQRGLFPNGTTVTILTSGGTRTGTFSQVIDSLNTTFAPVYNANSVTLVSSDHHVHPHVPTADILGKNAKSVATYLFGDFENSTFNTDISDQINKVLNDSFTDEQYLDALIAVSPLAVGGVNKVHAQNIERHARSVDDAFNSRAKKSHKQQKSFGSASVFQYRSDENVDSSTTTETIRRDEPVEVVEEGRKLNFPSSYGQYETSFFLEPYCILYEQGQLQGNLINIGQVAFDSFTVGAGFGYESVIDENFVFELGAGYSYSNLDWHNGFGSAYWNTLYLAPFFGLFDQNAFLNAMVLGGFNFTVVDRGVPVEGIAQTATGKFTNYDLLVRTNGGARWAIYRKNETTGWIQAEGTLNYLNIYTPEYTETGAGALDLKYQKQTQSILQPIVMTKFIHELVLSKGIIAPVLKLGWMGTFPLKKQIQTTKLALSPTSEYFKIQGYSLTNQMIVGAELFYKSPREFKLTSGFDTYFFDKSFVLDINTKIEWIF